MSHLEIAYAVVRAIRVALIFFFFNDTATTEIYTLSLHDALPISHVGPSAVVRPCGAWCGGRPSQRRAMAVRKRSEEHTSELQSQSNLVCRLLLDKKILAGSRRDRGVDGVDHQRPPRADDPRAHAA